MNDQNPYASSQMDGGQPFASPAPEHKEHLRRVASAQKLVMYALLANIVLNILSMTVPMPRAALVCIGIITIILSMVAVFSLAKHIKSTAMSIVYMLFMIVPCLSLLMLLLLNQEATKLLTSNGYKVGLMGANLDQFA